MCFKKDVNLLIMGCDLQLSAESCRRRYEHDHCVAHKECFFFFFFEKILIARVRRATKFTRFGFEFTYILSLAAIQKN